MKTWCSPALARVLAVLVSSPGAGIVVLTPEPPSAQSQRALVEVHQTPRPVCKVLRQRLSQPVDAISPVSRQAVSQDYVGSKAKASFQQHASSTTSTVRSAARLHAHATGCMHDNSGPAWLVPTKHDMCQPPGALCDACCKPEGQLIFRRAGCLHRETKAHLQPGGVGGMHDDGAGGLVPTAAEVLIHHHLGHHTVHLDAARTGNQPQR